MTRDDELRSRISDLAQGVEIDEISIDQVKTRGRRRNLNQRLLALAAAFLLVVGVAGVVRVLGDDDGGLDVAVEAGTDQPADTDSGAAVASPAPTIAAPLGAAAADFEDAARSYYGLEGGGGPSWVLPWGDGFVSFGQVWHEPTATLVDLIPDLADRFPSEVADALADAGVDSANVQESMAALEEAGLLDLVTEIVQSDPELFDAYMAATSATYSLEAQVSDDGVVWADLGDFSPPGEFGYIQSDGTHLVMADQEWRGGDESSGIDVWITTDLVTWTTVTIPIDRPAEVPAFATVNSSLGSLAIGPDGWYLTLERYSYVDLWSLLPGDLREEMEENGWGYSATAEGLRLETYGRESFGEGDEGFDYAVTPAASSSAAIYPVVPPPIPLLEEPREPTVERLVPWSELGVEYDDYASYLDGSSESMGWVGSWSGELTPGGVPTDRACCNVIGTEAGYLAMAWDAYEYADFEASSAGSLHFSTDGQIWTPVAVPIAGGFTDSIAAVDGGVVLTTSSESGQKLWRGESDGTNWQAIEIPGLPDDTWLWFGQGGGDGVVSVIDMATYDYERPVDEPDFWLVASADGLAWHVEDLADTEGGYYESPPAVNGTTVVVQMAGEWLAFDIG